MYNHRAARPSENCRAKHHKHGIFVHQRADQLTAADHNRDADEKPQNDEQKITVRCARNRNHIVDPHCRIGDDDRLDRSCKRLCRLDMFLAARRLHQLHGNRQQHQPPECLQVGHREQLHGEVRHDQTDDNRPRRTNVDRTLSEVRGQSVGCHCNDDGIIPREHEIEHDDRKECHKELR